MIKITRVFRKYTRKQKKKNTKEMGQMESKFIFKCKY